MKPFDKGDSEVMIAIQLKHLFALLTFFFITTSLAETSTRHYYVGSEACSKCHLKEYESFTKYAKKARSYESIERLKKGLTEEEISKCYQCHTTGYGEYGGFVSAEKTPHLKNTSCEVCHGPGSSHINTGSRKDISKRVTMERCEKCHIEERVRAFRFKPLIHGGAH